MARRKTRLSTDQRKFTIVYDDFLESDLLTTYEKIVFIALKKFTNSKNQCFPSFKKLADITGISKRKIQNILKTLEQKHVLNKDGSKQSNLYTLYDYAEIWTSDNGVESAAMIDELEKQRMIDILSSEYYIVKKEESASDALTKETSETDTQSNMIENDTTDSKKSQHLERYTLNEIKQLFDYEIMSYDNPLMKNDIDAVMEMLHTAMNTKKSTIRISGEDKPTMVVIGKLMKLHKESILYSIEKFKEQTERIKNPTAYMLTILFNAPEQYHLNIENKVAYDMVNCSTDEETSF